MGWRLSTDHAAPILEFHISRILEDVEFRATAAGILKYWIDVENKNIQRVSHKNHRFDMPSDYVTNSLPAGGRVMHSLSNVKPAEMEQAIAQLRDPLDGVTHALFQHDLLSAVRGMLLLRQLYWANRTRLRLRHALECLECSPKKEPSSYWYEMLDALGSLLEPAPNQTDQAWVPYAVSHELE